jgi:hypothetical protein
MRDGSRGKYGSPGNGESATCRFQNPPEGSNPTLTAILLESTSYEGLVSIPGPKAKPDRRFQGA